MEELKPFIKDVLYRPGQFEGINKRIIRKIIKARLDPKTFLFRGFNGEQLAQLLTTGSDTDDLNTIYALPFEHFANPKSTWKDPVAYALNQPKAALLILEAAQLTEETNAMGLYRFNPGAKPTQSIAGIFKIRYIGEQKW